MFVLVLGFSISVYAQEPDMVIEPREIAPCPVHGIHQMELQKPWNNVYTDTSEKYYWMLTAGMYKCECGETIICTGRPHLGHAIGEYYFESELNFIRGVDFDEIGSRYYWTDETPLESNSNMLPGFRFTY
ncbi:hypothetical protein [Paramaledivibacter caminithermalis]|uniref:hypothetical protein n=1 Tax=Paramaledivibacter caminithermalis TaxID=191027 RepID=UPI001041D8A0|nr:hypothetical protein [Paramaledivibacter caminithermalis]